jgi:hypothetical protein
MIGERKKNVLNKEKNDKKMTQQNYRSDQPS